MIDEHKISFNDIFNQDESIGFDSEEIKRFPSADQCYEGRTLLASMRNHLPRSNFLRLENEKHLMTTDDLSWQQSIRTNRDF